VAHLGRLDESPNHKIQPPATRPPCHPEAASAPPPDPPPKDRWRRQSRRWKRPPHRGISGSPTSDHHGSATTSTVTQPSSVIQSPKRKISPAETWPRS